MRYTVEEALAKRQERISSTKISVEEALSQRKEGNLVNAELVSKDIFRRYNNAVNNYKKYVDSKKIEWGNDASNDKYDQREYLWALEKLQTDVKAHRNYFGNTDNAEKILASIGEIKNGYKNVNNARQFYSQYKSEDDYTRAKIGWRDENAETNSESVKGRNDYYNDIKSRVSDLETEIHEKQSALINYRDEEYDLKKSEISELNRQKKALEADARAYESEQKVGDSAFLVTENEDFEENSKKPEALNGELDYLDIYLNTAPEEVAQAQRREREDYMSGNTTPAIVNSHSPYEDILKMGARNKWELISDEEKSVYYYYMNTQGTDAARDFLNSLTQTLQHRGVKEFAQDVDNASAVEKVFLNAATLMANTTSSVEATVDDLLHLATGQTVNPYSDAHTNANFIDIVRASTAHDIDEATDNANFLGFGLGDAYQAAMSGLDSFVGAKAFGKGYEVLMGARAFTSEAQRLYGEGASNTQVFFGALTAATAETVFEHLSLDHFLKEGAPKNFGQYVKKLLAQMGVEGSEELFTSVANYITNGIVMGSESDWSKAKQKYLDEGYSDAEATAKALLNDIAPGLLNDALGGFISAAGMSGIDLTAKGIAYQKALADSGAAIVKNGNVDRLVADAKGLESNKKNARVQALAEEVSGVNSSEGISRKQLRDIGRLQEGVANTQAEALLNSKQNAVKSMANGIVESRSDITDKAKAADVIAKAYTEKLSPLENAYFNKIGGKDILEIIMNKSGNESIDKAVDNAAINDFRKLRTTTSLASPEFNELMTGKSMVNPDEFVSNNGKTILKKSKQEITIVKDNALSINKNGKVLINTENKGKVALSNVEFGTRGEALLYESFADMSPAIASAAIANFDGDVTDSRAVKKYVNGMLQGINVYGKYNFKGVGIDIAKDTFIGDLSESDQAFALKLGKELADTETAKREDNIKAQIAIAEKSGKKANKKGGVVNKDAFKDLDEKQSKSIAVMDTLGKAMDVKFVLYDSSVDTKHAKHNGWYDATDDSIHIDIKAGGNHNGVMMFTVSHELTHFIKQWSPAKFKVFADFLIEQYGEHGVSLEDMKAAKASALNTTDNDLIFEEICADACERMLMDSNAIDKITELYKKDAGLVGKIKEFFRKTLLRLKSIYKELSPDSYEAQQVQSMQDVIEQLTDLWEDALLQAVENKKATNGVDVTMNDWAEKNTANSGVKTSIREIIGESGKSYGIGVYLDSELYSGLSDEERKQMLKLFVVTELAGKEFLAYDKHKNPIIVSVAKTNEKFVNEKGKKVRVNKDLESKYNSNKIKQQAVALADELLITAKAEQPTKATHNHEWLDNYGKNLWDEYTIYLQEQNKTVWRAEIKVANDTNGRKILYDVVIKEAVEGSGKSDPTTIANINVPQSDTDVNSNSMQNSKRYSLRDKSSLDAEYLEAVKNNDTTTAQRLVDEAAKANGYTIKAYHGTPAKKFSVFKRNANWFTDNESVAATYEGTGNTLFDCYIKMNNPVVIDANGEIWSKINVHNIVIEGVENVNDFLKKHGSSTWREQGALRTSTADLAYAISDAIDDGEIDCDGIVIKNIYDEGANAGKVGELLGTDYVVFEANNIKSADAITYDDNGNVIPLSQRFNSENNDIRFSMRNNVESFGDLLAVHNISEEKLLKTLQLGGFPMPSIAVMRAKMANSNSAYGDISVVFNKDTIDPTLNKNNKVFGGDVWSPVYPRIEYKLNEKRTSEIYHRAREATKVPAAMAMNSVDLHPDNLEDKINRKGFDALLEDYKSDYSMKQMFLAETGKPVDKMVTVEKRSEMPRIDVEINEYLLQNMADELAELENGADPREWAKDNMQKLDDLRVEYYLADNPKLTEEFVRDDIIGDEKMFQKLNVARRANRYKNEGAVTVITEDDYSATKKLIDERVDEKAYEKWLRELFDGVVEKHGIRNNVDPYTASGNGRSFEALHYEETLENVVKQMKTQQNGDIAFFGGTQIWAVAAKDYGTIDDVRADKARLQNLTDEEYSAIKSGFGDRFSEIATAVLGDKSISGNSFIDLDHAYSNILEAVRTKKTKSGILRELQTYYGSNVTEDVVDDMLDLIADVGNMPQRYFEAKPQRAVGFDEVKAVVVPDNISGELRSALQGYNVVEYKANDNEDRLKKLNALDGLKFSTRKYWYPRLTNGEWDLLNIELRRQFSSSDKYIDSATKWLYNEKDGHKVFAIYGIGDGTEPTVLYAVGGKKAVTANTNLQKYLEGHNDERNAHRGTFNRVLKNIQDKQRTGSYRFFDDGNGRTNDRDVQFPIEKRGSNSGADNVGSTEDSEAIKNSLRAKSTREILADALEETIDTSTQAGKNSLNVLKKYKADIEKVNEYEKHLREVNAEIKEISFSSGKRDMERLAELKDDKIKTQNRIGVIDQRLLRLEATKPLKDLLEAEKAKAMSEGKAMLKDAVSKKTESIGTRIEKERLQKTVVDAIKWMTSPSKTDARCPDALREPLSHLLQAINMDSKRKLNGGDDTQKDIRFAKYMNELVTAVENVNRSQNENGISDGYLFLPDDFLLGMRDLSNIINNIAFSNNGKVMNQMTSAELHELNATIRTLVHMVKNMGKVWQNEVFANARALGQAQVEELDKRKKRMNVNRLIDYANWDNVNPYYIFKRFGDSGMSIFTELMDAQDKFAYLADALVKFQRETWNVKEAKEWGDDFHEVKLANGKTITLSTAEAMSVYCTAKREASLADEMGINHLTISETVFEGERGKVADKNFSRGQLTEADVENIITALTPEQIKVADEIQKFMSTVCAAWGNEFTQKHFLQTNFTEPFYFPFEVNKEGMNAEPAEAKSADVYRLLNISAMKKLTHGANNGLVIRNIFEVFSQHAVDMAKVSAYGDALLDTLKWYNYSDKIREYDDDGNVVSIKDIGVKRSMEDTFGRAANAYIMQLIQDINGSAPKGREIELLTQTMKLAKTASVGANLRVAVLQTTAYPRALAVLKAKNLGKGLTPLTPKEIFRTYKLAKKHCGIVLWKSMGYYDINITKSVEEQLAKGKSKYEKVVDDSLKGAEWLDALTWTYLWKACEAEVGETWTSAKGTDEFYDAVGKKLREVVYASQVVDSTLTRSSIMRNKSGLVKSAAAFMSEPTMVNSMLADCIYQYRLNGKAATKAISKTLGALSITLVISTAIEILSDYFRDEGDEEFIEKLFNWKRIGSTLTSNFNPVNNIPVLSDISGAIEGVIWGENYSSSSLTSQYLTCALDTIKTAAELITKGDESSKTWYNLVYKAAQTASYASGLPAANLLREVATAWNHIIGSSNKELKLRKYSPNSVATRNNMYKAIMRGDTNDLAYYRSLFDDEVKYHNAIRTALKESDPRIEQAAQAKLEGRLSDAVKIKNEILAEGKFTEDDVVASINKSYNEIKPKEETEETPSSPKLFSIADYVNAVDNGTSADVQVAKQQVVDKHIANGKTEEEAEEAFYDSVKDYYNKAFKSGEIDRNSAIRYLTNFGNFEREGAEEEVRWWETKIAYPDIDMAKETVDKYYNKLQDSGISFEVYVDYYNKQKGVEADKDSSGKAINGSKKRKVLKIIDSLPITSRQKDAFYRLNGWAENKLYEAPWH